MDLNRKIEQLHRIYEDFEKQTADFRAGALCKRGCAHCCIHFGTVDITTLEGLVIRQWISEQPAPERVPIRERIRKNLRQKEKGAPSPCPFLDAHDACSIYRYRPFSCRQLYSLRSCQGGGPTVHRRAAAMAGETVVKLQLLDETGYSGHMSYVLHLLNDRGFFTTYRSGRLDPGQIKGFGKSHGMIINRMVALSHGPGGRNPPG